MTKGVTVSRQQRDRQGPSSQPALDRVKRISLLQKRHSEPGQEYKGVFREGTKQGCSRMKSEGVSEDQKYWKGIITWEASRGQTTAKLTTPGLRHPTPLDRLWFRGL